MLEELGQDAVAMADVAAGELLCLNVSGGDPEGGDGFDKGYGGGRGVARVHSLLFSAD